MRQSRWPLNFLLPPVRRTGTGLWCGTRGFSAALPRRAIVAYGKASTELEKRIDDIPLERFRNFCIVAHVVRYHLSSRRSGVLTWVNRIMERALVRTHLHLFHPERTADSRQLVSDRLLELTGTIKAGDNKQILDKLDVERERGITVKAQTCTMLYNYKVWLLYDGWLEVNLF